MFVVLVGRAASCATGWRSVLLLQLAGMHEMSAERASGKVLASIDIVWLLVSHTEGYVEGVL